MDYLLMPRLTAKLFTDLAIWMAGLGLLIGSAFPFLVLLLGFHPHEVFTIQFWLATLGAGLGAGLINYLLARLVIRPKITILAEHMRIVENGIRQATYSGNWKGCGNDSTCRVRVDSDDELGECARAFNDLVEALFRSREVESAVSDFSKALSSQLELEVLSRQALELLMQHTGSLGGIVFIEKSGELILKARHGLREPYRIARSDHVLRAMRLNRCEKVELPEDVRIEAVVADFQPREIMVVPIEFKNTTLGVVVLAKSIPFTADARWLMQLFRQSFGLALNNALTHDNLQRIAALDVLTGVYNRRFGLIRFREEFGRAVRTHSALGVLMLDIDNFKSINDTYGHLVGDRVLAQVTEISRQALRESDFIVRYGGEEFLMVLPGASREDSLQIAERVRRLIADTVVNDGAQQITFTASIGLTAMLEDNVEKEEDLLRHADQALYTAKSMGRNQVIPFH
jgi:diguanylate cyclase (GGDEF)-like protein